MKDGKLNLIPSSDTRKKYIGLLHYKIKPTRSEKRKPTISNKFQSANFIIISTLRSTLLNV